MKKLPYRVETGTGDIYDIEFPLHPETIDPVRVSQMVSRLLATIDRDLTLFVNTSNGDVMQAVSMVLAVRAGMVHADSNMTHQLASELLTTALNAVADAPRQAPKIGHA